MKVIIDGISGTGKHTIAKILTEKHSSSIEINDKTLLRPLIDKHWEDWPSKLQEDVQHYIVLESSPDVCLKRKPGITLTARQLFYERYKYRQLAGCYQGIHLINTDKVVIDEVIQFCESIIFNNNKSYEMPLVDSITPETFNQMPLVIDTNSKIVRKYNESYHIIELKPNVYSFILKGIHLVEGTDIERLSLTKDFIELLSREEIPHSYYCVGKRYILTKSLFNDIDLPPIETIVKKFYIGSDKHNYFGLSQLLTRHKTPPCSPLNEYNKPLVRFDFRNPEHNPKTGQVLGDMTLCDGLADEFINVINTKALVTKTFTVLRKHLNQMGLELYDMCVMVTINGDLIYAEISQDCTKIRPLKEDNLNEEEKSIWKSGGSSEKFVLQKYKFITQISYLYIRKLFNSIKA